MTSEGESEGNLKKNDERFIQGEGREWGLERNRVENVCVMTAQNDKHSCDSGVRVNHSGGDSFCVETH